MGYRKRHITMNIIILSCDHILQTSCYGSVAIAGHVGVAKWPSWYFTACECTTILRESGICTLGMLILHVFGMTSV